MLLMTGAAFAPAKADLVHKLTTSTQLSVDAAATSATRIGSTYSVSGNNIKVASENDHFGKLTAGTATAAATLDVVTSPNAGISATTPAATSTPEPIVFTASP